MMLCSQGVRAFPFVEGLRVGGVRQDDALFLTVEPDADWTGRLYFDCVSRTTHGKARIDWARLNEMPHWFAGEKQAEYSVSIGEGDLRRVTEQELADGNELMVALHQVRRLRSLPAD